MITVLWRVRYTCGRFEAMAIQGELRNTGTLCSPLRILTRDRAWHGLPILVSHPDGTHSRVTFWNYCFYIAYVNLASNLKLMLMLELYPRYIIKKSWSRSWVSIVLKNPTRWFWYLARINCLPPLLKSLSKESFDDLDDWCYVFIYCKNHLAPVCERAQCFTHT